MAHCRRARGTPFGVGVRWVWSWVGAGIQLISIEGSLWGGLAGGSRVATFLTVSAAWRISNLPTAVDPVKPTFLTWQWGLGADGARDEDPTSEDDGKRAGRGRAEGVLRVLAVGLEQISVPIAGASAPTTTLKIPGGTPARWASSARAVAEKGVSSDGLTTTGQPTARAGAHLGTARSRSWSTGDGDT